MGTPISLSWYSWQNNRPCNTAISSTGKQLVPFRSIAIPKSMERAYPIGTQLFIDGLKGKSTAGMETHSGWVEVADFCQEGASVTCYMNPPNSIPIVRLYIGDFQKAHATCTGTTSRAPSIAINYGTSKAWFLPMSTTISCKKKPALGERAFNRNYGGAAVGSGGVCGMCTTGKTVLGACYHSPLGTKSCVRK